MDLTVPQTVLARGFAQATRALAPAARRTLPITGDVLLQAQSGWLALSATNLDLSLTAWVQAEVADEGAATVPGRLMGELIATYPAEAVRLQSEEAHTLAVSCGRSRSSVRGHDPAEFPLLPQIDATGGIPIPGDVLRTLIGQSAFAAADDDARPVFAGVLVSYDGDVLTFVATDGFRIAVSARPMLAAVASGWSAIIPARTLAEVARIIPEGAATVTVRLADNGAQILFHTDYVQLTSRLIEGTYVDYARILPGPFTYRAVMDTAEWRSKLRVAALFARQSNSIVRLALVPAAEGALGTVQLRAAAPDVGDNVCDLDAVIEVMQRDERGEALAGTAVEPLTVAFNVGYIADALAVIKAEQVALDLTAATAPGVIRPLDGSDFQYCLMPMALPREA